MKRLAELLALALTGSVLLLGSSTGVSAAAPGRTAATVPGPVNMVGGFPLDRSLAMVWQPPASDGGSPITGYIAFAGRTHTCVTAGALSCVITGLTNHHWYSLHVRALNAIGKGPKGMPKSSSAPSIPVCSELGQGVHLLDSPNLDECNYPGQNLTDLDLWAPVMYLDDLSGANLSGSLIFNGNLDGADLANANLTGVTFPDGVNLSNVIWSNTTCPDGTNSDNDGGTCINNL